MTLADRLSQWPAARQRALALLLLAAGVALLWVVIAGPARWLLVSQTEWRARVREDLATSRGNVALAPQLQKQLLEVRGAAVWQAFYATRDGRDAATQMQRDLTTLAAAAGVGPPTFASLSDRDQPEYLGRGVRLSASMTAAQLRAFSAALRASTHFLRVEHFSASAPQVQAKNENPPLAVTMEVYGYSQASLYAARRQGGP